MSREAFLAKRAVSRETVERLQAYELLIRKWNPAINLVAKSTLEQIWLRHFLDSTQIFDVLPETCRHVADLGSGGGLPGVVIAVMAAEARPGQLTTLVESDRRKATFLATAVRELGLSADVIAERAETLEPLGADVVTARALAPLGQLVLLAERHLRHGGIAIFPKGATHLVEIDQATDRKRFSYRVIPSQTDANAVLVTIGDIERD